MVTLDASRGGGRIIVRGPLGTKMTKETGIVLLLFSLAIVSPGTARGETVLVSTGAQWKYLDDGSNQGTAWRSTGFDDGSWSSGPAQLGYGDGDEATTVSYGSDPNNKYVTTYFRHTFDVPDPSQFSFLRLRLLRDDGAVVHLNGTEVLRPNMPEGSIGYLTLAASTVGGADEDTFFDHYIDASGLITDTNVLAIEIHQRSVTSSDISFDLEVIGLEEIANPLRKAPYLICTSDNTTMKVLWQLTCTDTCYIEWGLDTSYSLGGEQTFEYGDDHQHGYTISGLAPGTSYCYRVIAEEDTAVGSFRAAPGDGETDIEFFAYGDTRTYPADHDQVAAGIISAYTTNPGRKTMLLCVGDLVSNGDDESDWDTEFFDPSFVNLQTMLANLPYQSCRGNHEGSGAVFLKYFPYPYVSPQYWSFDYGPAHFTVIDQYVDYSPGSAQYAWIVDDLSTTTKFWRFLIFHEPGWSAGGGHENDLDVQNYLQPLCLTYNVSIVFAGHNHYYSRAAVDGVQHITTGGGGAPLHTPNPSYPYIVAAERAHHFCLIDIRDGFLDFVAISAAGDTLDQFSLTDPLIAVEGADEPRVELAQNAPNPFDLSTRIEFSLSQNDHVKLTVFDLKGRLVRVLLNSPRPPGRHVEQWDGRDKNGRPVPSGVYFYELETGEAERVRKMILIR